MNKNIKDTFESFSPTEEQKEKIYQSIINGRKSEDKKVKPHLTVKLVYAIGTFLILAALAGALLTGPTGEDVSLPRPRNTYQAGMAQSSSVSVPTTDNNASPAPAEKSSVFKGFVLTAYAASGEAEHLGANYAEETQKAVLVPDVKILLAQYDPAMSSVPGLPFTVDITGEDGIEAITVSADAGILCKWDRDTGVVSPEGYITSIGKGETIYWSPVGGENFSEVKNITMTFEAIVGDAVVGRQNIYITQGEPGYYYATAGELELV